jgi:hypothetical protein
VHLGDAETELGEKLAGVLTGTGNGRPLLPRGGGRAHEGGAVSHLLTAACSTWTMPPASPSTTSCPSRHARRRLTRAAIGAGGASYLGR